MGYCTLRHAGVLVRSVERARAMYEKIGWTALEPVEHLRVQKMVDREGNVIELVEGNWHPHIAVNWYADEDGNYIEVVEVPKHGKKR